MQQKHLDTHGRATLEGDMRPLRMQGAWLVVMALWLSACADRTVTLKYAADPRIERLSGAEAVTIFRFADARGRGGGAADPLLVGGIYGASGNRLARVMSRSPWPDVLAEDLKAALSQRGVEVVAVPDRVYVPGTAVATPLVLSGEIQTLAAEARWGLAAQVSGVVRLYSSEGLLLFEKTFSAQAHGDEQGRPWFQFGYPLEPLLNAAVARWVRAVVMDPEVTRGLAPEATAF